MTEENNSPVTPPEMPQHEVPVANPAGAMGIAQEQVAAAEDVEQKTVSSKGRKVLTITLIILILLLLVVGFLLFKMLMPNGLGGKTQNGVTWIRSIYGFGNNTGELTIPGGVAIDKANGTFWMTDTSYSRLVNYRMDGSLAGIMSKPANKAGYLRDPADVAMDSDGLLYVVEPTYDTIRVFNRKGAEQGSFEVPNPLSIAVNDDNIVVGAESGFVIMDKKANIVKVVGTGGRDAAQNQFDKVNGTAFDKDGNIYIVDTYNNSLSKWTNKGKMIWRVQMGYPGNQQMTGKKEFKTTVKAAMQVPMGCTIDNNNRVIVIDMMDFSIAAFDASNGKFLVKYGDYGQEDGKLLYSGDIDYDSATDTFIVSDNGNKRAQIIKLPNSGGNALSALRNALSGPLALCCIPLLIIVICLAVAYFMQRNRKKKEQEKYYSNALEKEANNV